MRILQWHKVVSLKAEEWAFRSDSKKSLNSLWKKLMHLVNQNNATYPVRRVRNMSLWSICPIFLLLEPVWTFSLKVTQRYTMKKSLESWKPYFPALDLVNSTVSQTTLICYTPSEESHLMCIRQRTWTVLRSARPIISIHNFIIYLIRLLSFYHLTKPYGHSTG